MFYECTNPGEGKHPDWGIKVFGYDKTKVRNLLIANVPYWTGEYHMDGPRVDTVTSMFYLSHGRQNNQWCPKGYSDNESLKAIEFFKYLSSVVTGRKDGSMIITEESAAWPMVTHRPKDNGLGFIFK